MKGMNRPRWDFIIGKLIMNYLKSLLTTFKRELKETMIGDPYYSVQFYRKKGVKIGDAVRLYNVKIDARRPFLVEIGNNVIMTNCRVLTHDASTSIATEYTKIGRVRIGSNVFVGADVIILPNVIIGDNVIIGAGAVIAKDIPSNSVVVGNPQKIVSSYDDFKRKNEELMHSRPIFDRKVNDKDYINDMKSLLDDGVGFVKSTDSIHR